MLTRLDITGVRNLAPLSLRELGQTNIIYGPNGSGKTSILEGIHVLGMGRSFRSAQIKPVIQHNAEQCTVYGELPGPAGSVGVSRSRDGSMEARVAGERVSGRSELAAALPLQLIHAESFNLLAGGPVHRRQFMDWGVFHVEHRFFGAWQRFQRAIKQRNSLLRRGKISTSEIQGWDREFSAAGEQIDNARSAYLEGLSPVFSELAARLSPGLADLQLHYRRGWDKTQPLVDVLAAGLATDTQQGFTHVGPQRADIRITSDGHAAAEVLSRGQQKLVVCALKLAQGRIMSQHQGRGCIYLVDDLPAELDNEHCRSVAEALQEMGSQVFVTCVDQQEITATWPQTGGGDSLMFHVEQGVVAPQG